MRGLIISSLVVVGLIVSNSGVYSQSNTDTIEATVKANICGDGTVEGPEDCEGSQLRGRTCVSLGYVGGSLSCDAACEFDVSACTTTVADTATTDDDEITSKTTTDSDSIVSTIIQTVTAPFRRGLMPTALEKFDSDDSGRLEVREMRVVVGQWVEGWRKVMAARLGQLPQTETERLMEPDKETGMTRLMALLSPEVERGGRGVSMEKIEVEQAGELTIFSGAVEVEEENLAVCDINDDQDCNLIDLSIILYFIGR